MKNSVALIVAILILSGCRGSNPLTAQERASIQTIAVSPFDVTYKDEKETIYIKHRAGMFAGMGGFLGGLVYDPSRDSTPEEKILQHFTDQRMLQNTISEAIIFQFEQSGMFQKVTNDKQVSAAHMLVKMPILEILHSDGDMYKLVFRLDAQLRDNNGKVMWEDREFITTFNEQAPVHPSEKYINNPEILKQSISTVAQLIARLYIEDMGGTPAPLNKALHAAVN